MGTIKYWGEDGQELVGNLAAVKEELLKLDLLLLELEELLEKSNGTIIIDGRNLTQ